MEIKMFKIDDTLYVKNTQVAIETKLDKYSGIYLRKRIYIDKGMKNKIKKLNKEEIEIMLYKLDKLLYVITKEDIIFKNTKDRFYYYNVYTSSKIFSIFDYAEVERMIDEIFTFYREGYGKIWEHFIPLAERENRVESINYYMKNYNRRLYLTLPEDLKKEEELLLTYLEGYGSYSDTYSEVKGYLTENVLLKALDKVNFNIKLFTDFKPLFKKLLLEEKITLRKKW